MSIELMVLNHNGRALLEECLPSVVAAAQHAKRPSRVSIVDNASTDDSLDWLRRAYPQLSIVSCANRGLSSYNEVVPRSNAEVVVLLNNDVQLDAGAIDLLVAPLCAEDVAFEPDCFLAAPRCWRFDRRTHEGEKTAVRWRWGLVEGTAFFPGFAQAADKADWTAASGCVMALRRDRFVALGGFDPIFLPGRLEDLDLGYRGFAAGWHARYVPEALAYHRGAASFLPAYGRAGCDALAWRNALLFQWKHLRHPWHRTRMTCGIAARLMRDVIQAPSAADDTRWQFTRAFRDAWRLRASARRSRYRTPTSIDRERAFFARFHPSALARKAQGAAA